jgi:hypothetical protein
LANLSKKSHLLTYGGLLELVTTAKAPWRNWKLNTEIASRLPAMNKIFNNQAQKPKLSCATVGSPTGVTLNSAAASLYGDARLH